MDESNIKATQAGSQGAEGVFRRHRLSMPSWRSIPDYPVVVVTSLLAIAVSLAWWEGVNIAFLLGSAEIRRGQWWRLVTSVFPHVNIFHLAFDLYWLWALATTVERNYGHLKTVLLLLLFAAGSSAFEFAVSDPGVGLSGVGYGLFGLLYILSRHDERFRGSLDRNTETLFIAWFFICIFLTKSNYLNVGNVAHAAGALFGVLAGYAIVFPKRGRFLVWAMGGLLLFAFWGSTLGRPLVNFSKYGGYEEGGWGYDALVAHQDQTAVRWFRDAIRYQPRIPAYWYDLGIAYQRLNDFPSASAAYERAYELEPTNPSYAAAAQKKAEVK